MILNNSTAQNAGIGTTTPDAIFPVNDSFKITNGSRANGKVLTGNATGLATCKAILDRGVSTCQQVFARLPG